MSSYLDYPFLLVQFLNISLILEIRIYLKEKVFETILLANIREAERNIDNILKFLDLHYMYLKLI